jgi:membrane AbrB-like protein
LIALSLARNLLNASRPILSGLAIGMAGGALFAAVNFPAPWLAGSMVAAIIAVYASINIAIPAWLRALAFILLGILTGASVSWETIARAGQWPLSIALLAVTVIAVTYFCMQFFMKACGWDRASAFYGGMPGALSLTLALADEAKADMRRVTISQCIRLFFLVAALPAAIEWFSPPRVALAADHGTWAGVFILLVAGSALGFALDKLKIPAGLILGAILASAALYLSGIVTGAAPDVILIPANVILGVMIAQRVESFSLAELRHFFRDGFAGFFLALAVSSLGAAIASRFGGLSFALTLLAFAPGGLEAMTIMAFALDLDPAYVAVHQLARYVGIVLLVPPLAAWLMKRESASRNE